VCVHKDRRCRKTADAAAAVAIDNNASKLAYQVSFDRLHQRFCVDPVCAGHSDILAGDAIKWEQEQNVTIWGLKFSPLEVLTGSAAVPRPLNAFWHILGVKK